MGLGHARFVFFFASLCVDAGRLSVFSRFKPVKLNKASQQVRPSLFRVAVL